jgi:GNAT superfamily N-acetyltransferase
VRHAISPLVDEQLPAAVDVLRRAGFASQVGRLLEYPRWSPHGEIFGARDGRGTVAGVASCVSFGATGWIGALAVLPDARGAGCGTALTQAAVDWLRDRGAQTVLLYATDLGRPIYERLGFVAEGTAAAWRGVAGRAEPAEIRRLGEGDRDAVARLDAAATGETRAAVLDALAPLNGLAALRDGRLSGFALTSPWSSGRAIAATDRRCGIALLAAASAGPTASTLIVPDANEAAVAALRHWRFARVDSAARMRLGPARQWSAERQFGLFNLFWG